MVCKVLLTLVTTECFLSPRVCCNTQGVFGNWVDEFLGGGNVDSHPEDGKGVDNYHQENKPLVSVVPVGTVEGLGLLNKPYVEGVH